MSDVFPDRRCRAGRRAVVAAGAILGLAVDLAGCAKPQFVIEASEFVLGAPEVVLDAPPRMNIRPDCSEEPYHVRLLEADPTASYIGEITRLPSVDVLELRSVLRKLAARIDPANSDPPEPFTAGTEDEARLSFASYQNVHQALGQYSEQWRDQLAAGAQLGLLPEGEVKRGGFQRAQMGALSAYRQRDRVFELEEEAFDAGKDTLSSRCADASRGDGIRYDVEGDVRKAAALAESVDHWRRLTTALRTSLKARYPELPEADYPLNEFPDLLWRQQDLRLRFDRSVPVRTAQEAFHRIDVELVALNELSAFVDAELAAEVAGGALRYVEAVNRVAMPRCEGEIHCLAALEAEWIAAEGAAARADAQRSVLRARFEVALDELEPTARNDAFEVRQRRALDELHQHRKRLRQEVEGMAPLVARALVQVARTCDAIAILVGDPTLCLEVPLPPGVPPAVVAGPPFPDIKDHVFRLINAENLGPDDYGAYTYVLFGSRLEGLDAKTKTKYRALLEAIVATTASAADVSLPHEQLNLFAIPTRLQCETDRTEWAAKERCERLLTSAANARKLGNYDVSLSFYLRAQARAGHLLRREILEVIGTSPGPFLLTTPEPLVGAHQREGYGPLLFVDLSPYAPDSYERLVNQYKATIVDEPPSEQLMWEPPTATMDRPTQLAMGNFMPDLRSRLEPPRRQSFWRSFF